VVASAGRGRSVRPGRPVSIPFIAGQWSLPTLVVAALAAWRAVSIPFIAGQWSLPRHRNAVGSGSSRRFNPLHCGAVVASRCVEVPLGSADRFQSPSLRGSGRFSRRDGPGALRPVHVSIPFIAGQWSLHAPKVRLVWGFPFEFQSPSLRGSGRFARGDGPPAVGRGEFQSPSLRGSGRFLSAPPQGGAVVSEFQSPSLRGSGRFEGDAELAAIRAQVSIPFIAGQWSLPSGGGAGADRPASRFNPLHCGAVVAS